MNLLICVKQVPDSTHVEVQPDTHTVLRDKAPKALNPIETFAMELAARTKDQIPGSKLTVVSMGPASAVSVIKECLAVGGDQGYLVSDPDFAGSDAFATADALAHVVRYLEEREGKFDLIFCGKNTTDGDTAMVGPQLAELLDLPQVTYVTDVSSKEEGAVVVTRQTEDGYACLRVPTPAVLSVTKTGFEARFPSIKSKLAATRAKVPVITAEELGLDAADCGFWGSRTRLREAKLPEPKAACVKIKEETGAESAVKLFELLHSKHIL